MRTRANFQAEYTVARKRGGWPLAVYEHSLAIAFFALFFALWGLHALGGVSAFNEEQLSTARRRSRCGATDHFSVLVRVDAELAERIHRGRGDHRAVDLPASARVGRIEAGRRPEPGNQRVTTRCG